MNRTFLKSRGFTLLELMVSMGVGLIVLGAALMLFKQAVTATWVTSQKSEMQQDFRAAGNLIARDVSMAGSGSLGQAGLAKNSIGLPFGTGILPVYPCSTTTCNYINGAAVTYPLVTGAPYLYSITPGYNLGITVNAAEGPTDILTIAYADANLALNCYNISVTSATVVLFQLPLTLPSTCILPTGVAAPQPLNDPVVGLKQGDFILFGQSAAGVVTNVGTTAVSDATKYSAAYNVTFNVGDPGHIDQPTATNGSIKQLPLGPSTLSPVRLLLITYYLDISPIDNTTPRLMRIQSGKPPAPVAENVSYLKFSYDVDNNGVITSNQATMPAGVTPNMITKVNILHMTMRSQLNGTTGYQGLDLQTSISARNLTMGQEYPISGSAY
jgi:prepilin-type N-terminal cleavage/methylation domain-containing protein